MADHVSEIFGFVLRHGTVAEEVLFPDDEGVEPLPGLTEAERAAIDSVQPHLQESWIDLLTVCRESLWQIGAKHPAAATMRTRKVRPSTMYKRGSVSVQLISGRVHAGMALNAWGAEQFHIYVWVWVKAGYRKLAETVTEGIDLPIWQNEYGSFLLTLDTPRVGESFEDIGRRTAEKLWQFARPIADAVRQEIDKAHE